MKDIEKMKTHKLSNIFSIGLNCFFTNKMQEINAIFGQQQIESIANTLNWIDNPKYDKLDAIKKCNKIFNN